MHAQVDGVIVGQHIAALVAIGVGVVLLAVVVNAVVMVMRAAVFAAATTGGETRRVARLPELRRNPVRLNFFGMSHSLMMYGCRLYFPIQKHGACAGRKGKILLGHFRHDSIEVHTTLRRHVHSHPMNNMARQSAATGSICC